MTIFEFAMKMELDGEKYYRELAEKNSSPRIRRIFRILAEDEVKHYRILKEIAKSAKFSMEPSRALSEARNIFQDLRENADPQPPDQSQIGLYEKAREIEKKSEDFYRARAEETTEPELKDLLLHLAEEEKKHGLIIGRIIDFVSRPDSWIEQGDFYHLDDL